MHLHVSVARRPHQLPQFDETCDTQISAMLRLLSEIALKPGKPLPICMPLDATALLL
jgi:hypothetical protein